MSADRKRVDGVHVQNMMTSHITANLPQIEQQIAKLGQNALKEIGQKIKPRLPAKLRQEWSKLDDQHKTMIKRVAKKAVKKIWSGIKAKVKASVNKKKRKGTGRKKTTKTSNNRRRMHNANWGY